MGRVSFVNRGRADRDRSSFHQSLKLSLLASIAGLAWAVPAGAQNNDCIAADRREPDADPDASGTGGEFGLGFHRGRHRAQSVAHRA